MNDKNFDWSQNVWKQAETMYYLQAPYFAKQEAGYGDLEIIKMKRIYDWMRSDEENNIKDMRMFNFYNYFRSHDERRGTDFCKTFPELEDFYDQCKEIKL